MAQASGRMRDAFIEEVLSRMRNDDKIFFLSADLGSPVLDLLRVQYPERFVNVGIAEQNLINIASGLALEGFKVIAYAIAPFISMRCYEQVRVNLAMLSQFRDINVTLVGVGAGLSYDVSGPSHQTLEDLSIMRVMPNMQVLSPSDDLTARLIAGYAVSTTGPKYVRLDGKPLPVIAWNGEVSIRDGFRELKRGQHVCLLSTGYMTHRALAVAQQFSARGQEIGVLDMLALGEFNRDELSLILRRYQAVMTIEEGFVGRGGLDTLIQVFMKDSGVQAKHFALGLPFKYLFNVGDRNVLLADAGLDENSIARKVNDIISG